MSVTISSHHVPSLPGQQAAPERIVLFDVGWRVYEMLLEAVGDRNIRLTYDDGDLEIMTLSLSHENWKKRIARLIEMLSFELNVPILSVGAITCKRGDLDKGLEPDESYYIQHEAQMRGKAEFNAESDPPPDLVVGIDISYRAISREKIYAAVGVPEVWRFDGQHLHALRLASDRQYQATQVSLAFPALKVADLERFLKLYPTRDETSVIREFCEWVRTNLLPHRQ
jgi:Uma2 family endonuclease